jgi:3',5'-cyclic AMP phosphodiesterase CpdA
VERDAWALLADIHLAADRTLVEMGVNMADNFAHVSKELLALSERPEAVLIDGDCAFASGQKADYSTVAELAEPIRLGQIPIHLTLGNHDNRERFWEVFGAEKPARPLVADRQVAIVRNRYANWFLLDSLDRTESTPGLLGPEQLDWLAKALDANADKPALVIVHHNPGLTGGNKGLTDSVAFLELIRPRRHVKAYIFGHTHSWNVEQDGSGIHFINLPPVAYVFQPGKPSGWVHAKLNRNGMRLELRCVDRTHKAHGQVVELSWRA